MKSLGKIIKKKTGAKNLEALTLLMKKAPYSQPIQKLGKELSIDDTADILLRYDWTADINDQVDDSDNEGIRSMGVVKYKKEKKKKADKSSKKVEPKARKSKVEKKAKNKKIKGSKSSDSQSKPKKKSIQKIGKTQPSPISKKKAISSKTKTKTNKKQKSEKLDDYTIWLNSLNKSEVNKSSNQKKVKSEKKKKTKKSKKKSELKKKIDTSVKVNDTIASKSLAKLYEKEGHYKKAIKVYKVLSLKNPKKSGFFAVQIQKLKDKL